MKRSALNVLAWTIPALAALAGCQNNELGTLQGKIISLQQDNTRLADEKQALQGIVDEQSKQLGTLRTLGGQKRLEKLYLVQSIGLGRFTGGIGGSDEKGDDGVKVYIEPTDQYGSILKAAGSVKIQSFDLAAPPKDNLVQECRYDVDETAKHWFGGFGAYHYSFECHWKKPPKHDELTVRVEFTEYITGKTFSAQTVCKIKMTPVKLPTTTRAASAPTSKPK